MVERYSHVMHISSTVTGQLRDDCDAFDALLASLPAGTVSGAPKVRAMEIIDELATSSARPLRWSGWLYRLFRQHGHLYRAADDGGQRSSRIRASRCWDCG